MREDQVSVTVNDKIIMDYIKAFIRENPITCHSPLDVVRLMAAEFIGNHPLGCGRDISDRSDKLREALTIYNRANGSISPGVLQRRRIAENYQEAVSLIEELEASGQVDPLRTTNVAHMQ